MRLIIVARKVKTYAATTAPRSTRRLRVLQQSSPLAHRPRLKSVLRQNNNSSSARMVSTAAGDLTLGIGLGFVSVGLGILGLIIKSD